jgi:large-conductance mechanosensitive channel
MVQEIITYIIIAVAIAVAIRKLYKTLAMERKKKENPVTDHNCSDCIADCKIRDASISVKQEKPELCEKTIKTTDS